jgi:hypothetical protein
MARKLALLALLAAGCSKGRDPAPEVIAKDQPALASKDFYRVDVKPLAPCASGSTCEAKLVLTALGEYKVNDDYPFKFVADPASGVAIEGEGSFEMAGTKQGTMTVRFKPAKPGPATLTGTFKLSVCSEATCEIEAPKIALDVTSS